MSDHIACLNCGDVGWVEGHPYTKNGNVYCQWKRCPVCHPPETPEPDGDAT